jgi:hypothetical protein
MAGFFQKEADEEKIASVEIVEEREAFWLETLHLAMAELRAELKSENLKVRSKAAHKIIDLERTKLRHGRGKLAGRASDGDSLAGRASVSAQPGKPDFAGVPASAGLELPINNEDRLKPGLQQDQVADRLKAGFQRNQNPDLLAGRASDGNSEDPSLALAAKKMAEIEAGAGAIDMLALDIQTMTAKLAGKLQLKNRSMTSPEAARAIIARYMRVNEVTALKIDPHDIALVVMNMMADYKEHEAAEVASSPATAGESG